jgi:hypothetical protein
MRVTKIPVATYDEALAWIRARRLSGLGILQVCHDDFCAALQTHRDADCGPPCVPDIMLIEPFAVSPAEAKAVWN